MRLNSNNQPPLPVCTIRLPPVSLRYANVSFVIGTVTHQPLQHQPRAGGGDGTDSRASARRPCSLFPPHMVSCFVFQLLLNFHFH